MFSIFGHLNDFSTTMIRGSLLAFAPKVLGGGRDLWIVLCHFYKCGLSSGHAHRLNGHSTPICCSWIFFHSHSHRRFLNFALGSGHARLHCSCPPVLESYLVKLPQHNTDFETQWDVTGSKAGYQWPHKRTCTYQKLKKNFFYKHLILSVRFRTKSVGETAQGGSRRLLRLLWEVQGGGDHPAEEDGDRDLEAGRQSFKVRRKYEEIRHDPDRLPVLPSRISGRRARLPANQDHGWPQK